jgi:triphosphoribosyl-dephospho-CoA synthase
MHPEAIAEAFIAACEAELAACKPGNVHIHAAGHRMTVEDFRRSAVAAAPELARPGARLGSRIRAGVEASLTAAGQNTNLGILLLCTPIAKAAEAFPHVSPSREALRRSLSQVLANAEDEDARDIFAAISLANPGGLGAREAHDVREPPRIGLRGAMALAAGEDRIAAAYTEDFEDIFGFGLPVLDSARATFSRAPEQVCALYLAFLGDFLDSHISRKFGRATALRVQREARSIRGDFFACAPDERLDLLMRFDASLKTRGLNPGTSADLTVATLFADRLSVQLIEPRR